MPLRLYLTHTPATTGAILQFNRAAVEASFASGEQMEEDGLEDAFELLAEVPERIRCVTDVLQRRKGVASQAAQSH